MSKSYDGPWVFRSMLFTPGHIEKMARKASTIEADCIVLDLEDAVPEAFKAEGRILIRQLLEEGLFEKRTVFVRINPLSTGATLLDLDAVACRDLHGFVYPMAYTPDDIKSFDAQLRLKEITLGLPVGHFSVVVLIETALGVLNAYPIAKASNRVVGLLFGCEDYIADTHARHSDNDMSFHTARAQVVLAARAAGVEPIDTPYVHVYDVEGLEPFARRARDLGMSGMLVMTPRQIPIAHKVYTPSEDEVASARKLVEGTRKARKEERGIAVVEGQFVSPPTLKAAQNVLARAQAIESLVSSFR